MPEVSFFDPKKEAEVKRRRLMAEQLMKQSEQTPNEVVSGIVVKKSPIEGLAKALGSGLAGYQAGQADKMQTEDTINRQKVLAEAIGQYGTNPAAAAQMLMQSPSTSDMGMKLYLDDLQYQRDSQSEAAKLAREDANWERDAELKRELARMRTQSNQPYIDENGVLVTPKPKLSATEQKEFFEADDRILAGENSLIGLENALTKNDTAYSGALADERAWLTSNVGNLLGKETPRADATVSLKNSVVGQALESLKTVFGSMPTEGERKILLELQASVDKTPTQRKEILDRAKIIAQRRLERDRMLQEGLSSGNVYNTSPAQTATAPQGADALRAQLQGKIPADRIEAYIKARGF